VNYTRGLFGSKGKFREGYGRYARILSRLDIRNVILNMTAAWPRPKSLSETTPNSNLLVNRNVVLFPSAIGVFALTETNLERRNSDIWGNARKTNEN
jgi:hypothetical protein